MNWKKYTVNLKKIFRVQLKKPRTVKEDRPDRINEYTFSVKMHNPEYIPDKEIRKLIVLNPWTAISSPPLIQVVKDGNEDTEIMIGFKIINMKEGKMIEQRILEFLRKSGNQI